MASLERLGVGKSSLKFFVEDERRVVIQPKSICNTIVASALRRKHTLRNKVEFQVRYRFTQFVFLDAESDMRCKFRIPKKIHANMVMFSK